MLIASFSVSLLSQLFEVQEAVFWQLVVSHHSDGHVSNDAAAHAIMSALKYLDLQFCFISLLHRLHAIKRHKTWRIKMSHSFFSLQCLMFAGDSGHV